MNDELRLTELHRRLEELEMELAAKCEEVGGTGSLPVHHRQHAAEIADKAADMRGKLDSAQQSGWDAMKHEIESDWDTLMGSFGRWVRHVDKDFNS